MQDYQDYEVWVVGDGCTDESETLVRSLDPRVHWMNLPENSGTPSQPRRAALERAAGQFIAYLGHDDLWFPWHLSSLVGLIETSASGFVYSLGLLVSPQGVVGSFTLPGRAWDRRAAISPSNWLHRRELIDRFGTWSDSTRLGDDRDFLGRLQGQARFAYLRELSVLKFPAAMWRMYSLTSSLPQSPYLDAMRIDARKLALDLLTDLASRARVPATQIASGLVPLPAPLRALVERALDAYGRQRWPLNELLYRRWRVSAGLPGRYTGRSNTRGENTKSI
jgi:hypothetical protein